MEALFNALINGLALGMAYALIAVGYSIVFGILRLINFSHSSVYAFGAYMVYLRCGVWHHETKYPAECDVKKIAEVFANP